MPNVYWQRAQLLLWHGLRAARVRITVSAIPNRLNCVIFVVCLCVCVCVCVCVYDLKMVPRAAFTTWQVAGWTPLLYTESPRFTLIQNCRHSSCLSLAESYNYVANLKVFESILQPAFNSVC